MLSINNVYKSFGSKQVLNNLSLTINDGSIFGLVGVNGAGKSTLLRSIAGVYQCDSGTIVFDDCDTYKQQDIRKTIAFVSDEQYYPIGATIKSAKTLFVEMYDFDNEKYMKYLKLFELDENASINNLSKGNKRRVALLFALSINPKLLLLDEAYDGLEPLARLKFKKALAEMVEEGCTVIISSHNLKELEDICDSYGILEDGAITTYGDLIESKQMINKYQIVFKEDKTIDDFKDFEIMHSDCQGRVWQFVIKGNQEEVQQQFNAMNPLIIDVLPVNFEELFIYELESRGDLHE